MKKTTIIIVIIGFLLNSCDDFLEHPPLEQYTSETLFESEGDLRNVVNNLYNIVEGGHCIDDNFPNKGWPRLSGLSDDMWNNQNGGHFINEINGRNSNGYFRPYNTIGQVNVFLAAVPKAKEFLEEEVYRRYVAEARFFRAYEYTTLNMHFGDVPLVVTEVDPLEFQANNTRESVFDWVDKELEDLAPDLEGNAAGRISPWVAKALRARHLLNAISWHSDKSYLYSEANAVLTDIIQNGGFSLEPGIAGFQKLFSRDGETGTTEAMWTRFYDQTLGGTDHSWAFNTTPAGAYAGSGTNRPCINFTSRFVEAFPMANGADIRDAGSGYDPANPWSGRDPRLDVTILKAGEELPKRTGNGTFEPGDTYVLITNPAISGGVANDKVDKNSGNLGKTGYWPQKYQDFNWVQSRRGGDIHYHQMRYAEVLLMQAEAILGNTGDVAAAMVLVDQVRQRAFSDYDWTNDPTGAIEHPQLTASSVEEALDAILLERRLEFGGENNLRLFDLIRHRLFQEAYVGTLPGGGDKAFSYGIPIGSDVDPGDLDDSKKIVTKSKLIDFTEEFFYKWPYTNDRNPLLFEDPVTAEAWVSFHDID